MEPNEQRAIDSVATALHDVTDPVRDREPLAWAPFVRGAIEYLRAESWRVQAADRPHGVTFTGAMDGRFDVAWFPPADHKPALLVDRPTEGEGFDSWVVFFDGWAYEAAGEALADAFGVRLVPVPRRLTEKGAVRVTERELVALGAALMAAARFRAHGRVLPAVAAGGPTVAVAVLTPPMVRPLVAARSGTANLEK